MTIPPRRPRFIQLFRENETRVRSELLEGLAAPHAHVSPKFLYDALGSRLFEAITELPEYYPTRVERHIFDTHAAAMAERLGTVDSLVDLGAGNCAKAARLFDTLRPRRYVAVDISVEFLREALTNLQHRFPALDMLGVGMDFSTALDLPTEAGAGPRTLFYPGSSIGNFIPEAALAFLRQARTACAGGALLIGVDLVKPADILVPAYDDPLQVTAAFNRNLLLHANRIAGTDFRLEDWGHLALFDSALSRIEMQLEARRAVTVRWPGGARAFAAGERIHTENSCKWHLDDFDALLRQAGFTRTTRWTDERGWFAVFCARD
jgi:dimethylhistidine N-methyltransferase